MPSFSPLGFHEVSASSAQVREKELSQECKSERSVAHLYHITVITVMIIIIITITSTSSLPLWPCPEAAESLPTLPLYARPLLQTECVVSERAAKCLSQVKHGMLVTARLAHMHNSPPSPGLNLGAVSAVMVRLSKESSNLLLIVLQMRNFLNWPFSPQRCSTWLP